VCSVFVICILERKRNSYEKEVNIRLTAGQVKKGRFDMDGQGLKILAYFMAANFQAVVLIGLSFELVSYLESHYFGVFYWSFLVWPSCVLIVGYLYYVMMRQVLQSERRNRKKK
jgi:hypothetical protein